MVAAAGVPNWSPGPRTHRDGQGLKAQLIKRRDDISVSRPGPLRRICHGSYMMPAGAASGERRRRMGWRKKVLGDCRLHWRTTWAGNIEGRAACHVEEAASKAHGRSRAAAAAAVVGGSSSRQVVAAAAAAAVAAAAVGSVPRGGGCVQGSRSKSRWSLKSNCAAVVGQSDCRV